MKKLIDLLFGRSRHCDFGKLRLRRKTGEVIEVEKSLRYTVKSDGAKVTLNSYSELVHFCREVGITKLNSDTLEP